MRKNLRSLKMDERQKIFKSSTEPVLNGEQSIETNWRRPSKALTVTAQNTIPNEERRGRRRWMTGEILEKNGREDL